MPLAPLTPDPRLAAEDEWLAARRAQLARANAALPEIIAELYAQGRLRPMQRSRDPRPPYSLDHPDYQDDPGWLIEMGE